MAFRHHMAGRSARRLIVRGYRVFLLTTPGGALEQSKQVRMVRNPECTRQPLNRRLLSGTIVAQRPVASRGNIYRRIMTLVI